MNKVEKISPDQKSTQIQTAEATALPVKTKKSKIKIFHLLLPAIFCFGVIMAVMTLFLNYKEIGVFRDDEIGLMVVELSLILVLLPIIFYAVLVSIFLAKRVIKRATHLSLIAPILVFIFGLIVSLTVIYAGLYGSEWTFTINLLLLLVLVIFSIIFYVVSFFRGLKKRVVAVRGSNERKEAKRLIIYGILGFLFFCIVGLAVFLVLGCGATNCMAFV